MIPSVEKQQAAATSGAQDSQRHSAEHYRHQLETVCNNATLAMFIMDARQHCTYMNPAAEKLTGYTLDEVRGGPLHDFVHHTHPDGTPYPISECPIDRALPENNQEQGEDVFVHKNGTFYPVAYTASPLREGGQLVGTIIEVRDITRERQIARLRDEAIAEAEAARAEAEAANRAKDEFLAMLGHELRNPLAPILTALQLMRMRDGSSNQRERTVIERQVNHVVRLVDDLLDVSRIARGKVQLRREPLELADVVTKALEMASPLIEEKRHRVEVNVARKGALIDADPTRLGQVVSNLLTNAAKYTEPGGHIRVSGGLEGGEVVLRVRDNGMGIPAELLPHVFDLFVQGPRTIERSQGGLGLGLTLVRNITTLHGGSVSAQSGGQGQGSEFLVRLPMSQGSASQVELEPEQGPSTSEEPRPRQVLVVDDNQDAAETLAELLETYGYQVRVAHDGLRGLALARESQPDVALLDIGLPVMDGYELAQRLRAEHPAIRLVAITGYGQESDKHRSHVAGFDRHLIKPVDLQVLSTLLEELTQP